MRNVLSTLKTKLFGGKPAVERRNVTKLTVAPEIGDFIVYHHLKMQITETKTNELLKWLLKHGWRPTIENDRRRYQLLPENAYAKLDLAPTSERPMIIRSYMRQK